MGASGASPSRSPRCTRPRPARSAGWTASSPGRRVSGSDGGPASGGVSSGAIPGKEGSSMALKPWHTVVRPREDLRENQPLDASEFAVHLDHVRTLRAPDDYKIPERFFERTYLTKTLL